MPKPAIIEDARSAAGSGRDPLENNNFRRELYFLQSALVHKTHCDPEDLSRMCQVRAAEPLKDQCRQYSKGIRFWKPFSDYRCPE